MMMAEIYKAAWMWSPVYVLAQTTKRASTQHGDWHVCRVNALVCVCSCTSQQARFHSMRVKGAFHV